MTSSVRAPVSSPESRALRAAQLREDFVAAVSRGDFAKRANELVAGTIGLFAEDAGTPPLSGHIRHDTLPNFCDLALAGEDPLRFPGRLLTELYRGLLTNCLLSALRYDEGTEDSGGTNAVFFLEFLDIITRSLQAVMDASSAGGREFLALSLESESRRLRDIARASVSLQDSE